MATQAYILIEAAVGKAKPVAEGMVGMSFPNAKVVTVNVVTGPYDVIALLEADDLDHLGTAIASGIQQVDGVQSTTTCLVVKLG